MSRSTPDCPSLPELESVLLGSADQRVRDHVSTCDRCAHELDTLRANEALWRKLSDLGPLDAAEASTGGPVPGYRIIVQKSTCPVGTAYRIKEIVGA